MSKHSNFMGLALSLALLVQPGLQAQAVYHGTILVDQIDANNGSDSIELSLSLGSSIEAAIDAEASSRGDYFVEIPLADNLAAGVLIASIAENGRNNFANGDPVNETIYPTVAIDRSGGQYFAAITHYTPGDGVAEYAEYNINTAFAYFPFSDWLAGYARNSSNGGAITELIASDGLTLGTEFIDVADEAGVFTLNLGSDNHSQDGILLVSGGKNEDNFALSKANSDGSFTIFSHDNGENGIEYEQDPVVFAYLPADRVGTDGLVAIGRVLNSGAVVETASAGQFDLTKSGTGSWLLQIHGFTPDTGTLLVSPEGGDPFNVDNTVSTQYVGNSTWKVESRDLPGYNLQSSNSSSEPMFSFAFFSRPLFVDAEAEGDNSGTDWANAYTSLQDALENASAGQEIWVAEGIYYPSAPTDAADPRFATFTLKSGVQIFGGFPTGGSTLAERDPTTHETILSGDLDRNDGADFVNMDNNAYNVLFASETDAPVRLDGFTIKGGNADGNRFSDQKGGGLFASLNNSLTISNCLFQGNRAEEGGAIYNTESSPTITNCTFQGNQAVGDFSSGGAIYTIFSNGTIIANCSFEANTSSFGGAIFAGSSGSFPTITDCSFQMNQALLNGGAIANNESSPTITNCSFLGNQARNDGGAISNSESSPIITNSSFQGNQAEQSGGAIWNGPSASPTLNNSILWNNAEGDRTDTLGASIENRGNNTPTYSHSLIQNWTVGELGDSSNLDGTLASNAPRFVAEIDPLIAVEQRVGGDLRLLLGSPAINLGLNSKNDSSSDLAGKVRIQDGIIDLGAYEGGYTKPTLLEASTFSEGESGNRVRLNFSTPVNGVAKSDLIISYNGVPLGEGDYELSGSGSDYIIALGGTLGEGFFDLAFASNNSIVSLSDAVPLQIGSEVADLLVGGADSGVHYVNAANQTPQAPYDTWAKAANSLQDALIYAVAGEQMWVAEGTYYPDEGGYQTDDDRTATFTFKSGVEIYGGFKGSDAPGFEDRDPARYESILSGDIDQNDGPHFLNYEGNAFHVLTADGTNLDSLLDGFTISSGNADRPDLRKDGNGGGFTILDSASPTIRNCTFRSNRASYGGAIAIEYIFSSELSSTPTIENCFFLGNFATDFGGAISSSDSLPTVRNTAFQGNAAGTGGGAINAQDSIFELINCSLQGNSSGGMGGGAIVHSGSSLSLTNCIIWNNAVIPNIGETTASTNTKSASLAASFEESTLSFSNCLIENWSKADLDGSGDSPDTNLEPTDPRLITEVNPLSAPNPSGRDLRLLPDSPAIDAGLDSAVNSNTDLAGNTRKVGTIDLGAFENQGTLYVRASGGNDSNDGSSWNNAFATFQKALADATPDQIIYIAEGTYTDNARETERSTFVINDSFIIFGGFPANGGTVESRDPRSFETVFTAAGEAQVFQLEERKSIWMDGIVFADSNNGGVGSIAYLRNTSGSFLNCVFRNNSTTTSGGALYLFRSTYAFQNCHFLNNESNGGGGAIACSNSQISFFNSLLESNSASIGGAIEAGYSTVTVDTTTFRKNVSSANGGALYISSSETTVTNSVFLGNQSRDATGGAVWHRSFGLPRPVAFTNCTFQGNRAAQDGGALFHFDDSSPTLTNCLLWNNAANGVTTSRGASIGASDSATPTYINSLIQNWTAAQLNERSASSVDNLEPSDPRFVAELNPLNVENEDGGDLRLLFGSPAIDTGLDSANSSSIDLAGNTRSTGPIDLGAYENQGPPEISLSYQGSPIENGDNTPSINEGTNFGSSDIDDGDVSRTFLIENSGISTLSLQAPNSSDSAFIISGFGGSVAPGGSRTFEIIFKPTEDGTATAVITIPNNDPSDTPYTFSVSGQGVSTSIPWYAEAQQIQPAGWRYFQWFKGFKPEGENWIYHGRHGWLYVIAEDTSGIFLWDSALDRWLYTREGTYPWMYAYGDAEGWLFFFEGGRLGQRFFLRGDNGQTISEQDLSLNTAVD